MFNWLRRLMYGRYGSDSLNNALLLASLVLMVVRWFIPSWWVTTIILLLLVLVYLRMFSRNLAARQAENQRFLGLWQSVRSKSVAKKRQFDDRKYHRYLTCPNCKATLRVPRGKGKISVVCPKCKTQFVSKS